jgi:hypothetical protein
MVEVEYYKTCRGFSGVCRRGGTSGLAAAGAAAAEAAVASAVGSVRATVAVAVAPPEGGALRAGLGSFAAICLAMKSGTLTPPLEDSSACLSARA